METGGFVRLLPLFREVRANGAAVMRYHIERVSLAGCEGANEFLRDFFEGLLRFCEEEGSRCADKYASLPRRERAGFSPLFIKGEAGEFYEANGYLSFVYRVSAADKTGVLHRCETGLVFEASSGRLCAPAEFLKKGQRAMSDNFYLTERGVVFLEGRSKR